MQKKLPRKELWTVGRDRWALGGAPGGRALPILGEAAISCERKRTLRIDEFTYEIICWLFTKIDKRALLDNVAFVHEHDFITEIGCFRQIVETPDMRRRLRALA